MRKAFASKKLRADLLLIGLLVLAAGLLYLFFGPGGDSGAWAVVRVDGEEEAAYIPSTAAQTPL